MYVLTCHFSDIPPNAPVRGAHRHISAPTLFCTAGKGWEWNDGETYHFEVFDLLIVPPYTIHQHGGDRDVGCQIYVPQSRMIHALGLLHREQIKFGEKPNFPDGTEPLYDNEKKLIGYRIKKGVLGIKEDLDVLLGPSPDVEGVFRARLESKEWTGSVDNTYDRYLKLLHQSCDSLRRPALGMDAAGPLEMVHPSAHGVVRPQSLDQHAGDSFWQPLRAAPPSGRRADFRDQWARLRHTRRRALELAEGRSDQHSIHG
jgi:hypothetical protein